MESNNRDVRSQIEEFLSKRPVFTLTENDARLAYDTIVKYHFESQSDFCWFYHVHRPSFSQWLTGKKSCKKGYDSILLFLKGPPTPEEIAMSKEERRLTKKPDLPTSPSINDSDPSDADALCFIDGDNSIQAIYSLLDIPIDTKRVKVYSFHAQSFSTSKQRTELMEKAPWLTTEYEKMQLPDVADFLMSMKAIRVLDSITARGTRVSKTVFLVSADRFIDVVATTIRKEYKDNNINVIKMDVHKQENLALELHRRGLSDPNFDLQRSEFLRACDIIEKNGYTDMRSIIDKLNKYWPQIEKKTQYLVLPFTLQNVVHYLLKKKDIKEDIRPAVRKSDVVAGFTVLKTLVGTRGEISLQDLERSVKMPDALDYPSWRDFLERNESQCADYGITFDRDSIKLQRISIGSIFGSDLIKESSNVEVQRLLYQDEAKQIEAMIAKIGLTTFRKLAREVEQAFEAKQNGGTKSSDNTNTNEEIDQVPTTMLQKLSLSEKNANDG